MEPPLPPDAQRVVQRLVHDYGAERIILFGSYAEGRAGEDSDVDLLVVKETDADFYTRVREARRSFRDPGRRTPVDVIVLTPEELQRGLAEGNSFLGNIVKRGVLLHAA
jgi:predicted nucleotidyltransferase